MSKMLRLSRFLGILLGVLSPLLETIRRWSSWKQDPLALFDDYIIAALLLYGVWRVSKDQIAGQKWLVAGWGFASGMIYASVDFQVQQVKAGATDPAPIPIEWVLVIKLIGVVLVLTGLIGSLMAINEQT